MAESGFRCYLFVLRLLLGREKGVDGSVAILHFLDTRGGEGVFAAWKRCVVCKRKIRRVFDAGSEAMRYGFLAVDPVSLCVSALWSSCHGGVGSERWIVLGMFGVL